MINIKESLPDGVLFDYLATMKRLHEKPSLFFRLKNKMLYRPSDYEKFMRRYRLQLRSLFLMRIVAKEFNLPEYKKHPNLWLSINIYIVAHLCGLALYSREEEILKRIKMTQWGFLRKRIHALSENELDPMFLIYENYFGT